MVAAPSRSSFFPQPPAPLVVVSHRGGSLEAAENTEYALERSVALGTDWQEVDVGLSRDQVATILHDDSLLRTTGSKGRLEELHSAELALLSAHRPSHSVDTLAAMAREGLFDPPHFTADETAFAPKLRVPTLQQALRVPGSRYMLELKTTAIPRALVRAVMRDVEQTNASERVALASFDAEVLSIARELAPTIPRIGVAETLAEARDMLRTPLACLAVHCDIVDEVRATVPPQVALWCWTVYTAAQAERMRVLGVDGLITDAPRAVLEGMGRALPVSAALWA